MKQVTYKLSIKMHVLYDLSCITIRAYIIDLYIMDLLWIILLIELFTNYIVTF